MLGIRDIVGQGLIRDAPVDAQHGQGVEIVAVSVQLDQSDSVLSLVPWSVNGIS